MRYCLTLFAIFSVPGILCAGDNKSAFVPLLSQEEAWKFLPPPEKETKAALPNWALALAKTLPRATAAMLELDYLSRAKNPLDAKLRGKIRWVAAHANQCAYALAQAEVDLRRAGVTDEDFAKLKDLAKLPAGERAVLDFARKMTLAAYTVTDAEVADLVKAHGEKDFTAMVLLLAYANFQDRILLSLGIPQEKVGPLSPLEIRFVRDKSSADQSVERTIVKSGEALIPKKVDDADWLRFDFGQLKKKMETQKAREPRVRVPTWDEVKKHYPEGAKELKIKWSLTCTGYQPELALAWSACTRAYGQEAAMDRVFEESIFWVTTRALQCFY